MDTKEQNCAERIGQELKSTEEQVKAILAIDDYTRYEQLANLPLSVETVKETTITLSWGGPADYLHITHSEGVILRLMYRFSDWFDTATQELDCTSPLWDYAQIVIDNI